MKKLTEKQLRKVVRNQETLVAQQVRRRRIRAKLSQQALADGAGIDRKTVNRIERGHFSPSVETVARMAAVLNIKPIDLMK
jgi:putative transcriptional regulator